MVLAEGECQMGQEFTRGREKRTPHSEAPSSWDSSLAGHVLSVESQSLLGEKHKVISWALILKLVKGAVGNSRQLILVIVFAHCGSPRLWVHGIQLVLSKDFWDPMFLDFPSCPWTLRFSSLLRYL